VKVYRGNSLQVLPQVREVYDCVLIDGDHNWHTVFNELRLIHLRGCRVHLGFGLGILQLRQKKLAEDMAFTVIRGKAGIYGAYGIIRDVGSANAVDELEKRASLDR
jgi:hypothetical protein